MCPWIAPNYSTDAVDAAGRTLVSKKSSASEKEEAYLVVNNWRSCHGFPLNTLQMALRRHAAEVSVRHVQPLVAQRIKRLPAILHKLSRLTRLSLSQVQDIGGCRAVLSNVPLVYEVRRRYDRSRQRHALVKEDDYIASPKASGYRGIHLVFEYRSERNPAFDGLRIEIQLRSYLQHAWATAVETVSMFNAQYLKSSQGDAGWLRFFALMGSVIAMREHRPLVPATPATRGQLIEELRDLETKLGATAKLMAYGQAMKLVEPKVGSYFLLKLDVKAEQLEIVGYGKAEQQRAVDDYASEERSAIGKPGKDIVLVSVDSVKHLRSAYPNYYLDTRRFVGMLQQALKPSRQLELF